MSIWESEWNKITDGTQIPKILSNVSDEVLEKLKWMELGEEDLAKEFVKKYQNVIKVLGIPANLP